MTSIIEDRREQLRAEAQDIEERLARSETLHQTLRGLREDIERAERRRDAFASYGSKPIEIPQPDAHYNGLIIEVEPLRSRYTGKQLAQQIQQGEIDPTKREIKRLEGEVKSLLSRAERA
jgi:hypothetical protein